MSKQEFIHVMDLPNDQLRRLYEGEPIDGFEVCEKNMNTMGNGFRTELIVFKTQEKYFKFMAVSYLEEELTFTKPFQVFKNEEHVTRTHYSNWVDTEDEED